MYNFKFLKINFSGKAGETSECYDLFIPHCDGLDTTTFFAGTRTTDFLEKAVKSIFENYAGDDYIYLLRKFRGVIFKNDQVSKYDVTYEYVDIDTEKYTGILEKGCLRECEPSREIIYPADTGST